MSIQKKNMKYEDIVVLVIYMPNTEALVFEENPNKTIEHYHNTMIDIEGDFRKKNGFMDMIICNSCVCGIFENIEQASGNTVWKAADEAKERLECFHDFFGERGYGTLLYGIGIAAGVVLTLSAESAMTGYPRDIRIGPVFDRAYSMAKKACIDSRRRIMAADSDLQHIFS